MSFSGCQLKTKIYVKLFLTSSSHKINQLQTSETETQNQIKETKKALSSAYNPSSAYLSVADTIVQQLEDKNHRKNNILF